MISFGKDLIYMSDGGVAPAVLSPDRVFLFAISHVAQDRGDRTVLTMSVQYDNAAETAETWTFDTAQRKELEDWLRSHEFGMFEECGSDSGDKYVFAFDVWINLSKILMLGDSVWVSREGAFSPLTGPFADQMLKKLGPEWRKWKAGKLDLEKKEEEDMIDEILNNL